MRKVLLISPHFDDAILSAGQFMAGRPDAEVVTVFGGFPMLETSTPYDYKCGFKNSSTAVAHRRFEDSEALAFLNATAVHWNFIDEQYDQKNNDEEIKEKIIDIIEKNDYEFLLVPLGLSHPDHLKVADLVHKLLVEQKITLPTYFWEDLPLRVVEPTLVPPRLKKLGLKEQVNIGTGPVANKIRALSCYKSQIGTGILDPYVMYVPERFWQ